MKFSIIIGVIHMLFGTTLKASNAIYFGKWEDLIFEAIPQFFFMLVTFGYMSFCIIYKWLINWEGKDPISIIQLFINFTSVEQPLYGPDGLQEKLQVSFVIICFVAFLYLVFVCHSLLNVLHFNYFCCPGLWSSWKNILHFTSTHFIFSY